MSLPSLTMALDAHDPGRLAAFWAAVLQRPLLEDPRGALLPAYDTQLGLRFVHSVADKAGPNQLHLHVTTTGPTGQTDTVAAALRLGAEHLDVGQLPDEEHVVLADPEGNEFCVIEPESSFLAGCSPLGEIACDGTRQVGLFWAEALQWPLVWDEDQETAIQSPHGGTKVAWGGPPLAPKRGRSRQRFELAVAHGELGPEIDRLVALGAVRVASTGDVAVEMADPDGNEFWLISS